MTPKFCKAAVFRAVGEEIRIEEFPVPDVARGETLVRVECCTICGSDLHTLTGKRQELLPSILGHEAIGVVEQLSDPFPRDVRGTAIQIGDRITWSVAAACGKCDRCVRGYSQKCRHLAKYGHGLAEGRYALSGGLAEYILLRSGSSMVKLPSPMPKELSCPANCATATVAAALRVVGDLEGKRVLIFGAGMLGLTAAAMAKTGKACSVTVVDRIPGRLQRANAFGADCAIAWDAPKADFTTSLTEATGTDCFDVIMELSGAPEACEAAMRLGDIGAQIVLVGSVMPSPPVTVDPERVVRGWLSIHGVHNYAPGDLQAAVDFLDQTQGKFPFAQLVERRFELADAAEAMRYSMDQKPVRVAVCT